jgi:hypothetical protein
MRAHTKPLFIVHENAGKIKCRAGFSRNFTKMTQISFFADKIGGRSAAAQRDFKTPSPSSMALFPFQGTLTLADSSC